MSTAVIPPDATKSPVKDVMKEKLSCDVFFAALFASNIAATKSWIPILISIATVYAAIVVDSIVNYYIDC